jgi:hypothetical protein
MIEIKDTKIRIKDSKESALVQKKLFELGCRWDNRTEQEQQPKYLDCSFLYISNDLSLGYTSHGSDHFFSNHRSKEIMVKDLLCPKKLMDLEVK